MVKIARKVKTIGSEGANKRKVGQLNMAENKQGSNTAHPITSLRERLVQAGARQVFPPRKGLLTKHVKNSEVGFTATETRLLVCVMYTPEEHFKEITDSYTLRCVLGSPYPSDFFELSKKRVDEMNQLYTAA